MRYTKSALLVFGIGLIAGLTIVSAEVLRWGWVASTVMALGIVLIPVGLAVDARRGFVARMRARLRPARSRPRKPAPKRTPPPKKTQATGRTSRRKPAVPARRTRRAKR